MNRVHNDIIESATRETLPLPVSAVILSGGKSSRMGRPKAFLPYCGKTLIEHRYESMRQLFSEVFIITNQPEEYSQLSVDVVKDIIPNRGPLVGILSGLLVSHNDYAFVIACDMPLVDMRLMREMATQRHGCDVLAARHEEGREPLLALYSKTCIPRLEEAIFEGDLKVMNFLERVNVREFEVPANKGKLPKHFNVNTPQDYSAVLMDE